MNSNKRLELLIQRAADGELTQEHRRELLEFMETAPDGWKQLACGILEEQLVGQSIRRSPTLAATSAEADATIRPQRPRTGFWYQHPVLTTVVTICIAFVLGLAVPWGRDAAGELGIARSTAGAPKSAQLVTDDTGSEWQIQIRHEGTDDARFSEQLDRIRRLLEEFNRSHAE